MDKLTTTIKREWLKEIVAGRKDVEYRDIKPYWRKLESVHTPFRLRLINGMQKNAPEATVEVVKIRKNRSAGQYELHLGKIIEVKNWDRRR